KQDIEPLLVVKATEEEKVWAIDKLGMRIAEGSLLGKILELVKIKPVRLHDGGSPQLKGLGKFRFLGGGEMKGCGVLQVMTKTEAEVELLAKAPLGKGPWIEHAARAKDEGNVAAPGRRGCLVLDFLPDAVNVNDVAFLHDGAELSANAGVPLEVAIVSGAENGYRRTISTKAFGERIVIALQKG